jgi:hypothetical protein
MITIVERSGTPNTTYKTLEIIIKIITNIIQRLIQQGTNRSRDSKIPIKIKQQDNKIQSKNGGTSNRIPKS